jgi:hypothetical protein
VKRSLTMRQAPNALSLFWLSLNDPCSGRASKLQEAQAQRINGKTQLINQHDIKRVYEIATTHSRCEKEFQNLRMAGKDDKAVFNSERASHGCSTTESSLHACHNHNRPGQDSAKI